MSVLEADPLSLLEYNPQYKLLICRKCRYAIQKSAIDSHLLRHKIYRKERQRLLQYTTQLDIAESHLVPSPLPGSRPISTLQVSSGFRCDVLGCGHLTVSAKRMQKHWSDVHGHGGTLPVLSSFSRVVKLQTFFRGTQNRYFEVTAPPESRSCQDKEDIVEPEEGSQSGSAPYPDSCTKGPGLKDFDMHALQYLHHFSTVTYFTLPAFDDTAREGYWQQYVLPLALKRRWLMSGLLAITAFHKAFQDDDILIAGEHIERAEIFTCQFRRVFISLKTLCSVNDTEVQILGRQIEALLNLAERIVSTRRKSDTHFLQNSLLETVQTIGCCVSDTNFETPGNTSQSRKSSSKVVHHLRALPGQLAMLLGRPDDAMDVLVILSVIELLVDCHGVSLSEECNTSVWQGISKWFAECPKHFTDLLSNSNPAALMIIAYWFAVLVRPIEALWYMQGLSAMAVNVVREKFLKAQMHKMLPLVNDSLLLMELTSPVSII